MFYVASRPSTFSLVSSGYWDLILGKGKEGAYSFRDVTETQK
jgi:hypothetical protein